MSGPGSHVPEPGRVDDPSYDYEHYNHDDDAPINAAAFHDYLNGFDNHDYEGDTYYDDTPQ